MIMVKDTNLFRDAALNQSFIMQAPIMSTLTVCGAVTIGPEGTITVLQKGKEPEIAEAFWNLIDKNMKSQKQASAQLIRAKNLLKYVLDDIDTNNNLNDGLYSEIAAFLNPK